MPLIYKINVLDNLKNQGYTTYKLRKDKILAESTIQKLRKGEPISWENIETLCKLLDCQPGDIMEYTEEK
ncbi:helix-turn-helix domain-containing protein [Anaerosporobacter sp.]